MSHFEPKYCVQQNAFSVYEFIIREKLKTLTEIKRMCPKTHGSWFSACNVLSAISHVQPKTLLLQCKSIVFGWKYELTFYLHYLYQDGGDHRHGTKSGPIDLQTDSLVCSLSKSVHIVKRS